MVIDFPFLSHLTQEHIYGGVAIAIPIVTVLLVILTGMFRKTILKNFFQWLLMSFGFTILIQIIMGILIYFMDGNPIKFLISLLIGFVCVSIFCAINFLEIKKFLIAFTELNNKRNA